MERDDNTFSFVALLEKIKKYDYFLSFERFEKLYRSRQMAINIFEKHFAQKGFTSVDLSIVDKDIKEIIETTIDVKTFVDKNIAHLDRNNKEINSLNFKKIRESIKKLEGLAIKYNILFFGNRYDNLFPEFESSHNWDDIFRVPWKEN